MAVQPWCDGARTQQTLQDCIKQLFAAIIIYKEEKKQTYIEFTAEHLLSLVYLPPSRSCFKPRRDLEMN